MTLMVDAHALTELWHADEFARHRTHVAADTVQHCKYVGTVKFPDLPGSAEVNLYVMPLDMLGKPLPWTVTNATNGSVSHVFEFTEEDASQCPTTLLQSSSMH